MNRMMNQMSKKVLFGIVSLSIGLAGNCILCISACIGMAKITENGLWSILAFIMLFLSAIGFIICYLYLYGPMKRKQNIHEDVKKQAKIQSLNQLNELANVKVLQSQISPHFLYNTLDSLRGELCNKEMYEMADAVETLSSLFRFSIDHKKSMIPFEEELDNTEKYIRIMQFRFPNRFIFIKLFDDSDSNIMGYQLPKLTIQPIVENAIKYGLEEKPGVGKIEIRVEYTEDTMCITVEDNGVGMDLDLLDEINRELQNDKEDDDKERNRRGIALWNINKRLKLIYGQEYGLSVNSNRNFGTQVQLFCPGLKEAGGRRTNIWEEA